MKKILFSALVLSGMVAYAQTGRVGINTDQPSATLDVKAKTNDGSGVLKLQNSEATNLVSVLDNGQMNINASTGLGTLNIRSHKNISSDGYILDVITNSNSKSVFNVKNSRKVGINTNAPASTLHIVKESDHTSGFRLEDGTQGTGKILTSDANGNASWQTLAIANKIASYTLYNPSFEISTTSFSGEDYTTITEHTNEIGAKVLVKSIIWLEKGRYFVYISHDIDKGEYAQFRVRTVSNWNTVYETYYGEWLNTSFFLDLESSTALSFEVKGLVGDANPSPSYYLKADDYIATPITNRVTILRLN